MSHRAQLIVAFLLGLAIGFVLHGAAGDWLDRQLRRLQQPGVNAVDAPGRVAAWKPAAELQ